jgi:hypothetical protein
MPFILPTHVKLPMPIASSQNSHASLVDRPNFSATTFHRQNVLTEVTTAMPMYSGSPIQNARFGTPVVAPRICRGRTSGRQDVGASMPNSTRV